MDNIISCVCGLVHPDVNTQNKRPWAIHINEAGSWWPASLCSSLITETFRTTLLLKQLLSARFCPVTTRRTLPGCSCADTSLLPCGVNPISHEKPHLQDRQSGNLLAPAQRSVSRVSSVHLSCPQASGSRSLDARQKTGFFKWMAQRAPSVRSCTVARHFLIGVHLLLTTGAVANPFH